jgi:hypothetical protein
VVCLDVDGGEFSGFWGHLKDYNIGPLRSVAPRSSINGREGPTDPQQDQGA